jgi:hypothetical protein
LTPDPEKEKQKKWWESELEQYNEDVEEDKKLIKDVAPIGYKEDETHEIIEIEGKRFKKYMTFDNQNQAQNYGEALKKKLNLNYRVYKFRDIWSLFIDVDDYDKRLKR